MPASGFDCRLRGCSSLAIDGEPREHSAVVFRDGPSGQRAALDGGPDIWELIATYQQGKNGEQAIRETAELLGLTELQVQTGLRYYREHPAEIDQRIRSNARSRQ